MWTEIKENRRLQLVLSVLLVIGLMLGYRAWQAYYPDFKYNHVYKQTLKGFMKDRGATLIPGIDRYGMGGGSDTWLVINSNNAIDALGNEVIRNRLRTFKKEFDAAYEQAMNANGIQSRNPEGIAVEVDGPDNFYLVKFDGEFDANGEVWETQADVAQRAEEQKAARKAKEAEEAKKRAARPAPSSSPSKHLGRFGLPADTVSGLTSTWGQPARSYYPDNAKGLGMDGTWKMYDWNEYDASGNIAKVKSIIAHYDAIEDYQEYDFTFDD